MYDGINYSLVELLITALSENEPFCAMACAGDVTIFAV
jgi:hypothetical protein